MHVEHVVAVADEVCTVRTPGKYDLLQIIIIVIIMVTVMVVIWLVVMGGITTTSFVCGGLRLRLSP